MDFSTNNFHLKEIRDKKYNAIIPTDKKIELFEGLEIFKDEISRVYDIPVNKFSVIITSGDRIGDNKMHGKGFAADIKTKINGEYLTTYEQMTIIERLNIFTGRGLYPDDGYIIHVDVRRGLYPSANGARISRWIRDGSYIVWNKDYHNKPFNGLVYPLKEG